MRAQAIAFHVAATLCAVSTTALTKSFYPMNPTRAVVAGMVVATALHAFRAVAIEVASVLANPERQSLTPANTNERVEP